MRDSTVRSRVRRRLLLAVPAVVSASLLSAQSHSSAVQTPSGQPPLDADPRNEVRLPNGKKQVDEILKDDYEKNLQDARDLSSLARSFEEDLEKNDAFVFSLSSLKKLDDMEKLTKRIRGRMKRF